MLPTDIGHGLWGLELTDIAGNVTLHEVSDSWQYGASLADTGLDAGLLIVDREINVMTVWVSVIGSANMMV